jgi:uncharacterized membrane protein
MKLKAVKVSLLFIFCLLMRLIPFRAPNVEPILAAVMPLSRVHGALAAFFFAAASIFSYDLLTGTLGVHTFFTLFAYGALGVWAGYYFKTREAKISNYVRFAIIGTLFFDVVTLLAGPLFFDQPLSSALLGQIPFTAFHLLGNIVFALTLSPAIHYLLVRKRKRSTELPLSIKIFNPKII